MTIIINLACFIKARPLINSPKHNTVHLIPNCSPRKSWIAVVYLNRKGMRYNKQE